MTRFAVLLIMISVATALLVSFFGILPESPFADVIVEVIAFLQSDSVHQGLSWLSWFFPIGNVVLWIPAVVNSVIVFYGAKLTLLVLKLHF